MKNLLLFVLFLLNSTIFCIGQNVVSTTGLSNEQREAYIQRALIFRKGEDFGMAIRVVDSILAMQPKDAGAILLKGDMQLQQRAFGDAVKTFESLLDLNYEPITIRINLSYALFMQHHPAKAIRYAKMAWDLDKNNQNAIVNYFNAMLWNIQTKKAATFLTEQQSKLSPEQRLLLKARLLTTSGDYKNGLAHYDSLSVKFRNKHYTKEYAEVLLGKKEFKEALHYMRRDTALFSSRELQEFMDKYYAWRRQNAGSEFSYFKDVGDNIRIENSVWWQQGEGRTYRLSLRAGLGSVESPNVAKTKLQFAHLNIVERWSKAWSGTTDLHFQWIDPAGRERYFGITGKQTIQYQPHDRRMIGLFIGSDILNYTASLLGQKIRSTNLGYITHIMLGGKYGFYSQGNIGFLTDDNMNQQFFGSFYHLFRTEPTFKAGINFSALHYKDNSIQYYFSPNRYLSTEIFLDYTTPLPLISSFYFQVQGAAGLQQIEKQSWESAFRIQPEIGFRLRHFESSIRYQTSNVASSTGTGYRFNWFTLRLAWRW
ncbi:cellulose synthase subunit BcsC-related outer membrane protein [Sphingobacterium sp.]|uniref:cellulose synthase subunit BcsC-related outer membrane protein n=1 Tax=Sphingobacterium sp. TaxID=341027 RepID=UPI0031CED570